MSVTDAPTLTSARSRQQQIARQFARDFLHIRKRVAAEGLLRRRYGYYALTALGILLALAGLATAFVLIGDSWWQLLVAAGLGVVLTQAAFVGHDAARMQVFNTGKRNQRASLVVANLVVGWRYGWRGHNDPTHHGHPSTVGPGRG